MFWYVLLKFVVIHFHNEFHNLNGMIQNIVKNTLKNIRGWKRLKNKNIQAGRKKWGAYDKKV